MVHEAQSPTSNRETVLDEDEMIISKTDTKGKLTYVNRTFMKISQLSEEELLGVQHNIIRHPDMPRGCLNCYGTPQSAAKNACLRQNMSKDGGFTGCWPMSPQTTTTKGGYRAIIRCAAPRANPSRRSRLFTAMQTSSVSTRPKKPGNALPNTRPNLDQPRY